MRVLAHLCQDPIMIQLFNKDKDIYRQLASKIMNKQPTDITTIERNKAKTINTIRNAIQRAAPCHCKVRQRDPLVQFLEQMKEHFLEAMLHGER